MLTLNVNKIYGPRQSGVLYVKKHTPIEQIMFGGSQENKLKPGTENIPAAVGLYEALALSQKHSKKENARLFKLQQYFLSQIKIHIPNAYINGPLGKNRLTSNINIKIKNFDAETLLFYLDAAGIMASSQSACEAGTGEPSHVLLAIGNSEPDAKSSVRFTLGKDTTKSDIDYAVKVLKKLIDDGIGKI